MKKEISAGDLFSFIMIWKIIYHFNKLVKLVNKING